MSDAISRRVGPTDRKSDLGSVKEEVVNYEAADTIAAISNMMSIAPLVNKAKSGYDKVASHVKFASFFALSGAVFAGALSLTFPLKGAALLYLGNKLVPFAINTFQAISEKNFSAKKFLSDLRDLAVASAKTAGIFLILSYPIVMAVSAMFVASGIQESLLGESLKNKTLFQAFSALTNNIYEQYKSLFIFVRDRGAAVPARQSQGNQASTAASQSLKQLTASTAAASAELQENSSSIVGQLAQTI